MESKKISIHNASSKELTSVKGIGDAAARKIQDFVEQGGTFTSIDEVMSVGSISSKYRQDVESEIALEKSEASVSVPQEGPGKQFSPGKAKDTSFLDKSVSPGIAGDLASPGSPGGGIFSPGQPDASSPGVTEDIAIPGKPGDIIVPGKPGDVILPGKKRTEVSFEINLSTPETIRPENLKVWVTYEAGLGFSSMETGKEVTETRSESFDVGKDGQCMVDLQVLAYQSITYAPFTIEVKDQKRKILYTKRQQVREGNTINLEIKESKDREIIIVSNKLPGIDYDGYVMSAQVKYLDSLQKAGYIREETPIAKENELKITLPPDHVPTAIDIEVKTERNVLILSKETNWEDSEWSRLDSDDLQRELKFDLPSPDSITQTIEIVNAPDDFFSAYIGHKLVVRFDILEKETLNFLYDAEQSFPIQVKKEGGSGEGDLVMFSKVTLQHYGTIDNLALMVKAPSGELLAERKITLEELNAADTFTLQVPHKAIFNSDSFLKLPDRPRKVRGRLLDASGRNTLGDRQIIIYVSKVPSASEEDFSPLLVFETEDNGYFLQELPLVDFYEKAFARVSVQKTGHSYIDVPIHLEEDEVLLVPENTTDSSGVESETKLFIPASLLLVVDMDESEKKEDCGCGDCKELDFHSKNNILDEFSYHMVVRTTEPEIQGYTLEEEGEMTIQEVADIIPFEDESERLKPLLNRTIRKDILLKYVNNKQGLNLTTLRKALSENDALKLKSRIKPARKKMAKGRFDLSKDRPIDWDEDPTIYQATTLAHGHLLHFKQQWIALGYSTGDIVNSIPLAPGQKKQVVVLDWEKRESAFRSESVDFREELNHTLSRDRDLNEIAQGVVSEQMKGGSYAKNSGWGVGYGASGGASIPLKGGINLSVGSLIGVSGGSGKSTSKAWQNSARQTALSTSQQIRDRTAQATSALRSQRATVVQTATQGETFSVESEVIANYNHCHSLTIQYFEVLRHLKVEQNLVEVQECLFIPLIITPFDNQKALRWKEDLTQYISNRKLIRGFDAIERIENNYEGSNLPMRRYADEGIEYLHGDMTITFNFSPPTDYVVSDAEDVIVGILDSLSIFNPLAPQLLSKVLKANKEKRIRIFYEEIAPSIALRMVNELNIDLVYEVNGAEQNAFANLEASLISQYKPDKPLLVSLRPTGDTPRLSRAQVKAIEINFDRSDGKDLKKLLKEIPSNSNILVNKMTMNYQTNHSSGYLVKGVKVNNDLLAYGADRLEADMARVGTPLNNQEMANPRVEDKELANGTLKYLNDNLELAHKAIWRNLDLSRLWMMVDGVTVTDYSDIENYPKGIVRSVASVVENKIIGFAGNSVIMPVAPGYRLDPNIRGKEVDLMSLYKPATPFDPQRFSLPTRGVFAEAVMGKCNSCEKIQEDRFWRWSEEPIPDSPTPINPVSTDSRATETPDLTPSSMPSSIVNIQTPAALPDPQGISAALQVLSQADLFRDITGLSDTQKAALAAFQTSMSSAQHFGDQAAKLADTIIKLKRENVIDEETAQEAGENLVKPPKDDDNSEAIKESSSIPSKTTLDEIIKQGSNAENTRFKLEEDGTKKTVEYERGYSTNAKSGALGGSGDGGNYQSGDGSSVGGSSKPLASKCQYESGEKAASKSSKFQILDYQEKFDSSWDTNIYEKDVWSYHDWVVYDFETGSADLPSGKYHENLTEALLDRLSLGSGVVFDFYGTRAAWALQFLVVGYSDCVGDEAYNETLRNARSQAMVDKLKAHALAKNIYNAENRIVYYGAAAEGDYLNIDSFSDRDNRALNRSVKIVEHWYRIPEGEEPEGYTLSEQLAAKREKRESERSSYFETFPQEWIEDAKQSDDEEFKAWVNEVSTNWTSWKKSFHEDGRVMLVPQVDTNGALMIPGYRIPTTLTNVETELEKIEDPSVMMIMNSANGLDAGGRGYKPVPITNYYGQRTAKKLYEETRFEARNLYRFEKEETSDDDITLPLWMTMGMDGLMKDLGHTPKH